MDNNRPIEIGFVINNDVLPSNFHYTCCCWIQNSEFFENPPFNFSKVFVSGTMEGPIVSFGIQNSEIKLISLLNAHHSIVSDLINSLQTNIFYSISNDGTFCGWRSTDTSCIFKCDEVVRSGNLFLSIHPTDPSYIWICSLGRRADLFDTKSRTIVSSVLIPSLVSFSYMIPANSVFVREPCIIAVTNNNIKQIIMDEDKIVSINKVQNISTNIHESYFSTPYGVVRTKVKVFSVLYEHGNTKDFELDISEDDSIQYVYWVSKKYMCLITFGGSIFLVTISHSKDIDRVKIENIQKYQFKDSFVSGKVDFHPDLGFIFPHANQTVRFINQNESLSFVPVKSVSKYSISNSQTDQILKLQNNNEIIMYNWASFKRNDVIFKTKSKITTIFSTPIKYRQQNLLVYAGCENGEVSFFFDKNEHPIRTVEALASSIIDFVILPFKIGGRESVLAIGEDGSIALIKWMDIVLRYPGFNNKVLEIYYLEEQSLLIIKYSNGEYLTFGLKNSDIVDILVNAPEQAKKFYPVSEQSEEKPFSLERIRFGSSTQIIARLRLDLDADDNDIKIQQAKYIVFRLMLSGVSVKNAPPNVDENCGSNLVILGESPNTMTFFYEKMTLRGPQVFESSENVSGIHFIAWSILSSSFTFNKPRFNPDSNGPHFLPLLAQLITHRSSTIRQTSSLACANAMMATNMTTAQSIVTTFIGDEHELNDNDKFLLSMVLVAQPDTLPSTFFSVLYNFLVRKMHENNESGDLATVILLNGFDIWQKSMNSSDLLLVIMREMVIHDHQAHVNTIFEIVSGVHASAFFQSMDKTVEENWSLPNGFATIRRLFDLTINVSFSEVDMLGAPAALRIALVGSKYPKLAQIVSEEIAKIALTNKCVAIGQNVTVIAVRGTCYVFRNCSYEFNLQITDSPITSLVLDSASEKCAAISNESSEIIVFLTRTKKESLLGAKKPVIEKRYEVMRANDVSAEFGQDGNIIIKYG